MAKRTVVVIGGGIGGQHGHRASSARGPYGLREVWPRARAATSTPAGLAWFAPRLHGAPDTTGDGKRPNSLLLAACIVLSLLSSGVGAISL